MKSIELKDILNEVFHESDKYEIVESDKLKYGNNESIFYIKRYSDKLSSKISCVVIKPYYIGTSNIDDNWELTFESVISMVISNLDVRGYLLLFKYNMENYYRIDKMCFDNYNEFQEMKKSPIMSIRNNKLNKIGI